MKTLGLLGGMSWESTATYYQLINQVVSARLGGLHSAKIILHSFDFAEIAALQKQGEWAQAGEVLAQAGRGLKAAGADAIVICTNTMHLVAGDVEKASGLPLLHIADATGQALKTANIKKVGLLGTKFTMEMPFYRDILEQKFGCMVSVPPENDRAIINDIIFGELCKGVITEQSRASFLRVIQDLQVGGATGIVLGCTEIGMLVKQEMVKTKLFDTTLIHASAAADFSLQNLNEKVLV